MDRIFLNVIDWEQLHCDVYTLAEQVMRSDYVPDIIIGIGYGGIIPSTLFYFAHPEVEFRIAYPKSRANGYIEPLPGLDGKKVLLVDDLAITGDSLGEIKKRIIEFGAAELKSACLYCSQDHHDLDYFVRRIEPGERIVFPWYALKDSGHLKVFEYRDRFGKHEPIE